MKREAHHVIITTVYSFDADIAYPLLYAISTGLIHRCVFVYVIVDLVVCQIVKGNLGGCCKTNGLGVRR